MVNIAGKVVAISGVGGMCSFINLPYQLHHYHYCIFIYILQPHNIVY